MPAQWATANFTRKKFLQETKSQVWKLKLDVFAKNVREMVVLNSKINALLTDYSNGQHTTPSQIKFLEKAIRINIEEDRPFAYYDFTLKPNYFRQMVYRLKNFIDIAYKSNPCSYRVKGTPWRKKIPPVTHRATGEWMIPILKDLKEQPPKLHDIKIKFRSNIHKFLIEFGAKANPTNKLVLKKIPLDQYIYAKVSAYPETVQVDLACTNKPILYDIAGVIHLSFLLGQMYEKLQDFCYYRASIPPFREWIVTHFHYGKDGTESYSGPRFHQTYEELATGLVRFYSKKMPDGSVIPRLEQTQTQKRSLEEEFRRMIYS